MCSVSCESDTCRTILEKKRESDDVINLFRFLNIGSKFSNLIEKTLEKLRRNFDVMTL